MILGGEQNVTMKVRIAEVLLEGNINDVEMGIVRGTQSYIKDRLDTYVIK